MWGLTKNLVSCRKHSRKYVWIRVIHQKIPSVIIEQAAVWMHIALNEGLQGLPYLLLLMEKMTEECYYLLRMPFLLQSHFCTNVDKISVVFYEQQLGPFLLCWLLYWISLLVVGYCVVDKHSLIWDFFLKNLIKYGVRQIWFIKMDWNIFSSSYRRF